MTDVPRSTDAPLEDVQGRADLRKVAINAAGIRGLRYPLDIADSTGDHARVTATLSMSVAVPEHVKGTHMSRFIQLLDDQRDALTVSTAARFVQDMNARLDATRGSIEVAFTWFQTKQAPVSGVFSKMDYEVVLRAEQDNADTQITVSVAVPATSLCPCSKEISDYGAHNQRSIITLTATLVDAHEQPVWISDLVAIAEREASSQVYGVLKRPDEKYVTEAAYDNPKFVEDMARDLAHALDGDTRIARYVIDVENVESIHNHSAFARVERDKRG